MINLFFSWLLVAFGQPSWSVICSVLAASFGYALFWRYTLSVTTSRARRFWLAVAWFFAVQLVQLSWLSTAEYHGFYIYLVHGGIALWLAAQFGLLTMAFPKKGAPTIRQGLALCSFWVFLEMSRLYFLCGFSFNPVGLALTAFVPSSQLAAIFGVFGLSFWVMFVNILALRKKIVPWALCALFPYVFGLCYIFIFDAKSDEPYRVALVQTGLRQEEKGVMRSRISSFIKPAEQWGSIVAMLDRAELAGVDLIVLPESALPYGAEAPLFAENMTHSDVAQAVANRYNAEVIVGLTTTENGKHFNSAFHLLPSGQTSDRYDKRVLVPLAEYLPLTFFAPLVAKYGITEFFTHGKEAKVFKGKRTIAPSICYEECFSHLVREGRNLGAALLVNVTNDGWYPSSRLPRQHFDHGKIRAVENGVPLVRACNTGVTVGVDGFGREIGRVDGEWTKQVLIVDIMTNPHKTPYMVWGNAGILLLGAGFLCGIPLKKK